MTVQPPPMQTERPEPKERPVLTGLIALVAVAIVVGGLLGAGTIFGAKMFGLTGTASGGSAEAGSGDSLYMPSPSPTASTESAAPEAANPAPQRQRAITLTAREQSVANYAEIHLDGTYPKGEGAVLEVQRKLPGQEWEPFVGLTASVSGGEFHTYVQTGQSGAIQWRMVDTDNREVTSNPVTVQVSP